MSILDAGLPIVLVSLFSIWQTLCFETCLSIYRPHFRIDATFMEDLFVYHCVSLGLCVTLMIFHDEESFFLMSLVQCFV